MPFLITLIICCFLGIVSNIYFYRLRKKRKAAYPYLWEQFELLVKTNADREIIELGNKIIYNKFVQTKHLEEIQRIAKKLELRNQEFKKLGMNAYDRWIHRTKGQGIHW